MEKTVAHFHLPCLTGEFYFGRVSCRMRQSVADGELPLPVRKTEDSSRYCWCTPNLQDWGPAGKANQTWVEVKMFLNKIFKTRKKKVFTEHLAENPREQRGVKAFASKPSSDAKETLQPVLPSLKLFGRAIRAHSTGISQFSLCFALWFAPCSCIRDRPSCKSV